MSTISYVQSHFQECLLFLFIANWNQQIVGEFPDEYSWNQSGKNCNHFVFHLFISRSRIDLSFIFFILFIFYSVIYLSLINGCKEVQSFSVFRLFFFCSRISWVLAHYLLSGILKALTIKVSHFNFCVNFIVLTRAD